MAENKVRFLRGTATEYANAVKDDDTFYYTTDDEKLYIGDKEITGGGVTVDDTLSETSEHPVQNKVITNALNNKAELSDIPTTLPANGGRSDAANAAYHQVEHFLESGTDILAYVTSDICPAPFNTIVRIMHSPTCPTNYGYSASDNDFFYHIFKLNNSWATVKAFDIRGNVEFINSCLNGTWSGWVRCNDGGNADAVDGLHAVSFLQNLGFWSTGSIKDLLLSSSASGTVFIDNTVSDMPVDNAYWFGFIDRKATNIIARVVSINNKARYSITYNGGLQTWYGWVNETDGGNAATVNGLTVQTAVPSNAKFTDTTYGAATASTTGLVSTGAQTFAGNKTFNGQILPAGASDVSVAQARKIYAGTADMTAGTTALETGAIYLVYE